MLILLSPAKTLDETQGTDQGTALPELRKRTNELITILKDYSASGIKELMHISDKLAKTNYDRYQNFSSRYTPSNSKAAIYAFKGDVYVGFEASTLKTKDISYAQNHVRILSGLYGILRPMDKMQPYRLEMGTKLKNRHGSNLYQFWGNDITKEINKTLKEHKDKTIINLASNEYFNSVNKKELNGDILDIGFKENRNGKLMFVSFTAKKARGMMARYIVQNRIERKEDLKGFQVDGYHYAEDLSSASNYMFVK